MEAELVSRNQALDEMSRTDVLTGLQNRRSLEERLAQVHSSIQRRPGDVSVLMLDIDHFKRVNDAHGHDSGDEVLRAVAERLLLSVRLEDVPGRWGGEEFLVLLPATDLRSAAVVAERVRTSIGSTPIPLRTGELLTVTVSIGAASGLADGERGLLGRADEALYAAKALGRDRVVSAQAPVGPAPADDSGVRPPVTTA